MPYGKTSDCEMYGRKTFPEFSLQWIWLYILVYIMNLFMLNVCRTVYTDHSLRSSSLFRVYFCTSSCYCISLRSSECSVLKDPTFKLYQVYIFASGSHIKVWLLQRTIEFFREILWDSGIYCLVSGECYDFIVVADSPSRWFIKSSTFQSLWPINVMVLKPECHSLSSPVSIFIAVP
jgi:hypothetical protein